MGSGRRAIGEKKLQQLKGAIKCNRMRKHGGSNFMNWTKVPRARRILKYLLGLLMTGILAIASYYLYQYDYSDQNLTVSRVLRRFVRYGDQQIDHERQIQAMLLEDPWKDLIKTGLQPIQARVSSLRTQTSQYEKMEQIPGGPINFITSALHELDTDVKARLHQLSLESLNLLAAYDVKWNALAEISDKMVATFALLLDKDAITIMVQEGMIIIPMGYVDPRELNKVADQVTLEEVNNMLDTLASLYEEVENVTATFEMKDDMDETKQQEIEVKMVQIYEYRNQYGKYLQVFQLLISRLMNREFDMPAHVRSSINEKQDPFIKLHAAISKDTQNLKTRITNLKYKYAKKTTEL